ncbi:MAG: class I SAM-dependent methyltransferase [Thermoanaerobaculia bacterium]|nr:class I SAM-dependent methyltransferase [Thermoanaerobaculia bacterium]
MTSSDDSEGPRSIEAFLGEPTRDRAAWHWLWTENVELPVAERGGLRGRLTKLARKALRPLVRLGGAEIFERQRVFNLILLEDVKTVEERTHDRLFNIDHEIEHVLRGHVLPTLARREAKTEHIKAFLTEGLEELMRYNDALYSRVDQKMDGYRREARDFISALSASIAERGGPTDDASPAPVEEAIEDWYYQELEARFRGAREEIRSRIREYLPLLAGRQRVLDLGCGRGEALEVFAEAGVGASGVDSSAEMVRLCGEAGLEAVQGDLLADLAGREEASLDGIVSFHVIEHLPVPVLDRLVKLAWRALEPGGVLVLETPNPLSLTMAANLFWRDPTHLRPVHPDVLRLLLELGGFDQVEIRPLHPFPDDERLPEIELEGLDGSARVVADRVNRLRDRIDAALFGDRDYAAIGIKAGRASGS